MGYVTNLLSPRDSGMLHFPHRPGSSRLRAAKFEYLSARLLPRVAVPVQRPSEIPALTSVPGTCRGP